jgi:hypothetical protein
MSWSNLILEKSNDIFLETEGVAFDMCEKSCG